MSICRVPTVLEKSLNFGFSLKSPWKWICPWKVLEIREPSLKFQLVVLEFLICVFWTESLNGYSKLRGTRANFSPKIWLASLAAAYIKQVKYFSSSSFSYIIIEQLLSCPSFPKNTYMYFMYILCFNVSICFKMGSLYSYGGIITKLVYPPELSRIADFVLKNFELILIKILREDPQTPFKQNCLRLYYNHNTANHLTKKLKTLTQIPLPPFLWPIQDQMVSACLILKSPLLVTFSRIDVWKNKEKSLKTPWKMYLKSPWKVLEKGMSWSVGTMIW